MSLPFFLMYPRDFEADTSHLSLEEDGAYNRLLRLMWMTPGCSLPDDDAWIRRRMRVDQVTFDTVVLVILDEFFTRENGHVFNARLAREHALSKEKHNKRVSAGKRGGKAKALKTNKMKSNNALAKPYQPEPEPEPYKRDTNVSLVRQPKFRPERFDEFWDQHPHRGGAKKGKAPTKNKYASIVSSGVSEQTLITAAMRYATDRQVIDGYGKGPVPNQVFRVIGLPTEAGA